MHMCHTCYLVLNMKMIQVRNVPDDLHRALKAQAARDGTTMSDLILAELRRIARRPSPQELLERIEQRTPVGGPPPAELIRDERNRR
jgi:hypothetical protein